MYDHKAADIFGLEESAIVMGLNQEHDDQLKDSGDHHINTNSRI